MRNSIVVVIMALVLAVFCQPTNAQKREFTNPYTYYHIEHPYPRPPYPPPPPVPLRPPHPPTPVRPWPYPVPYPVPYPYPTPYPVPDGSGTFISNPYTASGTSSASSTFLPTPKKSQAVIVILTPTTQTDLWVDGTKMPFASTLTRVFNSPDLEPEHDYQYTVKATWIERGEKVTQEKTARIKAGKTTTVDFTKK